MASLTVYVQHAHSPALMPGQTGSILTITGQLQIHTYIYKTGAYFLIGGQGAKTTGS